MTTNIRGIVKGNLSPMLVDVFEQIDAMKRGELKAAVARSLAPRTLHKPLNEDGRPSGHYCDE